MWRALILTGLCLAAPVALAESGARGASGVRLDTGADFALPTDPQAAAFVQSNLIFVFYHEVAHALIDVQRLAVQDREEDAADMLSALLIDRLWEEEAARALVGDTALAFFLYSEQAEQDGAKLSYWGRHSLDLQRYYNLVCLFYGADPGAREGLARDLDLPAERRESCPEEFQQAADGWGAMLDGMPPQDHGPGFRMAVPKARDAYTALIAAEVAALNAEYGLPIWVDVTVERCGEANAFYDPRARRVVMCIEYAEDLARLFASRGDR